MSLKQQRSMQKIVWKKPVKKASKANKVSRSLDSQNNKSIINNEKPFKVTGFEYSNLIETIALNQLANDFKFPVEIKDSVKMKDDYLLAKNNSTTNFVNDEKTLIEDIISKRLSGNLKIGSASSDIVSFDYSPDSESNTPGSLENPKKVVT